MTNKLKKLGLVCLLTAMAITLPAPRSLVVSGGARVIYSSGIVNVKKSQIVRPGYVIFTGKTGRAVLAFANGSRLRIGRNSHFKLVKYNPKKRRIVGRLKKGRVWSRVRKNKRNKIIIRGRYSTAAVLGTTWNFDVSDKETRTTVVDGSVAIHRPFDKVTDDNADSLLQKLPNPLFTGPAQSSSQQIGPPTEVASPVHVVPPPVTVIPGPYTVSKEQWLEIVKNQEIMMRANGEAIVSQVNPQELARKDAWFQWNQAMDKKAANVTE